MLHSDNTVLQAIPDPALIAVGGQVVQLNCAAAALFPSLRPGDPLPVPLTQSESAGLIPVNAQMYQVTVSPMGDGVLCLLRAVHPEGISRTQLSGTVRRLREHLSKLLSNVQQMERAAVQPNELSPMNHALCQMMRLTDHLDLLQTMESDAFHYAPVTLDLAGLCHELTYAAACLLEPAGIRLCYDSALTSLLVNGDCELLEKLLLELIANAARAAGKGEQITLTLARQDGRAVLIVSGPGADDGRPLPQLLSGTGPSDRIPSPNEGAGLGLTLAQRIVSTHGGALMMERQNGMRTIVALPLAKSGEHLPFHHPRVEYTGGFSPVLTALSDLLPDSAFTSADLD